MGRRDVVPLSFAPGNSPCGYARCEKERRWLTQTNCKKRTKWSTRGDIDGFVGYLSEDFVDHEQAAGIEPTKSGTRQLFQMLVAAFPDLRFDTEDVVESGERLAARARVTGTHKGDFFGIPATGKSFDVEAIDILRFGDDGVVHEHWGVMDMMSMMQQLGAIPPGPTP
jgi:steroid delta-isomerase-like uncharacterized protein